MECALGAIPPRAPERRLAFHQVKGGNMRFRTKGCGGLGAVLTIGAVGVALTTVASAASTGAQHARWDIIHFANGAPPGPISPGGAASAEAANGGGTITLTGSGTFVAPAGGGSSHSVTGGGTWTTSSDGRSGTYRVVELVDFEFANLQ